MNGGAFGENFPYSNFHDLNMDWIIKIAGFVPGSAGLTAVPGRKASVAAAIKCWSSVMVPTITAASMG